MPQRQRSSPPGRNTRLLKQPLIDRQRHTRAGLTIGFGGASQIGQPHGMAASRVAMEHLKEEGVNCFYRTKFALPPTMILGLAGLFNGLTGQAMGHAALDRGYCIDNIQSHGWVSCEVWFY
jgi:hypothetical protein